MNDSQETDYLDILTSLLASRREWEQVPEIVNLSIKAVTRLLQDFNEQFQEHKTLINEQSLKLKEFELKIEDKVSRKNLQGEVFSILNSNPAKREDDSISEYEKLIKESRYERERNMPPTIQELKTIAEIIAEKQTDEAKKDVKHQLMSQRLQMEERISTLKEEIKSRMVQIEREKRELASECRQAHSRIEESQIRPFNGNPDEKISLLQQSSKRTTEGLSHLINHLQKNFLTKEEVNLLLEQSREKKSPLKPKPQEWQKQKQSDSTEINKEIERSFTRFKNEERREWAQFKHGVMKEIGKMVNSDTINHLIDTFQKDMMEKQQLLTSMVNHLESKISSLAKGTESQHNKKELLGKSQRRQEKKSSPSKSVEVIQSSLNRLERHILQKQNEEVRRVEKEMDSKIESYDKQLGKQLDRRQRHLCEVIEETYNQHRIPENQDETGDVMGSLKRLFQTNLYCRYLYIGTKQCKKDSCIPWQKESLNNLIQNFIWKRDSSGILVNSPGLYRLEVGLFGEIDSETIILLNQYPFADIARPSKSRSTGIKVRGSFFSEVLLFPGKAKLSVRVGQHFYGQAFLNLQKM